MERYEINKNINFRSLVPMKTLLFDLLNYEMFKLEKDFFNQVKSHVLEEIESSVAAFKTIEKHNSGMFSSIFIMKELESYIVNICEHCFNETFFSWGYCDKCSTSTKNAIFCLDCFKNHIESCKKKKSFYIFYKYDMNELDFFKERIFHRVKFDKDYNKLLDKFKSPQLNLIKKTKDRLDISEKIKLKHLLTEEKTFMKISHQFIYDLQNPNLISKTIEKMIEENYEINPIIINPLEVEQLIINPEVLIDITNGYECKFDKFSHYSKSENFDELKKDINFSGKLGEISRRQNLEFVSGIPKQRNLGENVIDSRSYYNQHNVTSKNFEIKNISENSAVKKYGFNEEEFCFDNMSNSGKSPNLITNFQDDGLISGSLYRNNISNSLKNNFFNFQDNNNLLIQNYLQKHFNLNKSEEKNKNISSSLFIYKKNDSEDMSLFSSEWNKSFLEQGIFNEGIPKIKNEEVLKNAVRNIAELIDMKKIQKFKMFRKENNELFEAIETIKRSFKNYEIIKELKILELFEKISHNYQINSRYRDLFEELSYEIKKNMQS